MRDYAFYNTGISELKGWRRGIVPFRRLLRRVLRPMLYRQADLFSRLAADNAKLAQEVERLAGRVGQLEDALRKHQGLSSDILATKRRLAAMEDHLIAIDERKPLESRVHGPHFTNADSSRTR